MRNKIENAIATLLAGLVVCIPFTTVLILMSYISNVL